MIPEIKFTPLRGVELYRVISGKKLNDIFKAFERSKYLKTRVCPKCHKMELLKLRIPLFCGYICQSCMWSLEVVMVFRPVFLPKALVQRVK